MGLRMRLGWADGLDTEEGSGSLGLIGSRSGFDPGIRPAGQ